jgi:hypothetical protein
MSSIGAFASGRDTLAGITCQAAAERKYGK